MGDLLLCQVKECIGLVFFGCNGISDGESAVVKLYDSGVMSGCDIVRAQFLRLVQERSPFQMSVARNTRIWCVSVQVFVDKVVDHIFFEFILKINNMMRYAEMESHAKRILESLVSAAGRGALIRRKRILADKLHCDTYYIISLFF